MRNELRFCDRCGQLIIPDDLNNLINQRIQLRREKNKEAVRKWREKKKLEASLSKDVKPLSLIDLENKDFKGCL
jgi:DNA-directed RNA polymerase subunit M/transcription elongation factor TFIIS